MVPQNKGETIMKDFTLNDIHSGYVVQLRIKLKDLCSILNADVEIIEEN